VIEELAVVVKIDGYQVWVERRSVRACSSCQQAASCSTSLLGGLVGNKAVMVDSEIDLKPGDEVVVGIKESLLLRASLYLYLLPLMALLAGAGIADQVLTGNSEYADLGVALCSLFSLLLALWLMRKHQRHMLFAARAKPVVVKKV
jgi:sigma-E factor negative regulatory protein RseC